MFKNDDIAQLLHLLCIALMFFQYRTGVDVGALVDQATNYSCYSKSCVRNRCVLNWVDAWERLNTQQAFPKKGFATDVCEKLDYATDVS